MTYINQYQYYTNNGNAPEDANWGSYQYVSLQDIVNNFMQKNPYTAELTNFLNLNKLEVPADQKKKNFRYHPSGVVVDLLGVHFLPIKKPSFFRDNC